MFNARRIARQAPGGHHLKAHPDERKCRDHAEHRRVIESRSPGHEASATGLRVPDWALPGVAAPAISERFRCAMTWSASAIFRDTRRILTGAKSDDVSQKRWPSCGADDWLGSSRTPSNGARPSRPCRRFGLGDPARVDHDIRDCPSGDRDQAPGTCDVISTPFGPPLNCTAPSMSASSCRSAWPSQRADLASSLAEFTGVLPHGHGLRAEGDAVQEPHGHRPGRRPEPEPAMPWAARAATTPPAVPSLEATTASTLLLLTVRNCSMFRCATLPDQPVVGVGFADILDVAGIESASWSTSMLPGAQEVGIRVSRVALDEDVVALPAAPRTRRAPACGRLPCCRR